MSTSCWQQNATPGKCLETQQHKRVSAKIRIGGENLGPSKGSKKQSDFFRHYLRCSPLLWVKHNLKNHICIFSVIEIHVKLALRVGEPSSKNTEIMWSLMPRLA
ncbi:hypothetical protein E5288_WYG002854 [Bos mutus]|uniref:Uncharacterized protein n=1 Tax=Bos mutus TaxID=72004 RepID=A0A6B0S0F3_9CETA|nr:hypothetical protein [Bos mutus]